MSAKPNEPFILSPKWDTITCPYCHREISIYAGKNPSTNGVTEYIRGVTTAHVERTHPELLHHTVAFAIA